MLAYSIYTSLHALLVEGWVGGLNLLLAMVMGLCTTQLITTYLESEFMCVIEVIQRLSLITIDSLDEMTTLLDGFCSRVVDEDYSRTSMRRVVNTWI